ncbi:MAG: hypothetical protein HY287_16310 [Planctomycetes bacterium]|nr:hypothetical protein [Planctomycetota bacterium]MBI3835890.1 hypothetical protein [Planctomycetota bacterium]
MIEFKAECGHTVRAKDSDAGNVVRCSYCGRNANVPQTDRDDLSFLFNEVDQSSAVAESPRKRKWQWSRAKRAHKPGEFNPFPVIVRMCYAALLFSIVYVVSVRFIIPMIKGQPWFKSPEPTNPQPVQRRGQGPSPSSAPSGGGKGLGLIADVRPVGLYVASTPPGAQAYIAEESKAPASGRIMFTANVQSFKANADSPRLPDGKYVVEVALAWNDPGLSNYRNYVNLRRAIEHASDEARKQALEEYFVPDDAAAFFVAETEDQLYLVRQYRGVVLRGGQGKGVRALFLPRIPLGDPKAFSVEPMVRDCVPATKNYEFDEQNVRNELMYYEVTPSDQPFVLQALNRIGVIPYMTADRKVRLFSIGIYDGAFTQRVVRDKAP